MSLPSKTKSLEHTKQRRFQSFVGQNSLLSVQIRSKISKCSWNSIILPNTPNLGEFEGINGTCRTLQRPANSRCYCSCDWCLLPHRRWVVFIFNFALSVKKIYHGKLNAIDRYRFPCISLTSPVILLLFYFAIRAKRSIQSAMQADLQHHNAMWAEFIFFTEMGAVSVDKIATQGEEGFQIQLNKSWLDRDFHDRRVFYYLIWLPNDHRSTV